MGKRRDVDFYRKLPYTRRVEPRQEGGKKYWLAWIAELPSIEIHGDSREEALARLDEIFGDCIEVMVQEGDEIPEPRRWPDGLMGAEARRNLRALGRTRGGEKTNTAEEGQTVEYQGDEREREVPEWSEEVVDNEATGALV